MNTRRCAFFQALPAALVAIAVMSGCESIETPIEPRQPAAEVARLNTNADQTADAETPTDAVLSKNPALVQVHAEAPVYDRAGLFASGDKRLTILLGRDRLLMKYDEARPQQVTGWGSEELWKSLVRMLADLGVTADKQVVRVCAEDGVPWTLTHRLLRTLQTSGFSRIQICSADSVAADMM